MTSNQHRSRVVVDTPCPSGNNSRRNSSSSSSSDSSSVNSCNGAHQQQRPSATSTSCSSSRLTDEQFFQEWTDTASLVNFSRNPLPPSHQHQSTSLSINSSASIIAKVSVVPAAKEHQQRPPAKATPPRPTLLLPAADADNQLPPAVGLSLKCAVVQSNSNPSPAS